MHRENASPPVFTGAELALADVLAAVIEELIAGDAYASESFTRTASGLRERYETRGLRSSVAMIDYLRRRLAGPQPRDELVRLQAFDGLVRKESN